MITILLLQSVFLSMKIGPHTMALRHRDLDQLGHFNIDIIFEFLIEYYMR